MESEFAKPRRILLEAGPKLTRERVIAFTEKLFGPLTPEEREREREKAKAMMPSLPEK